MEEGWSCCWDGVIVQATSKERCALGRVKLLLQDCGSFTTIKCYEAGRNILSKNNHGASLGYMKQCYPTPTEEAPNATSPRLRTPFESSNQRRLPSATSVAIKSIRTQPSSTCRQALQPSSPEASDGPLTDSL